MGMSLVVCCFFDSRCGIEYFRSVAQPVCVVCGGRRLAGGPCLVTLIACQPVS